MNTADLRSRIRDIAFRFLPHRAPTGLFPIGTPGRDAPVLVTGNFTLTVRRLRAALAGHHVWLLVANSKGVNVWCASGGGYFTHHDIISAIRVSRLSDKVDGREIVLPQLCATGVEHRAITEATGFETRWGPARLEDLPAFLDRGLRVHNSERHMRFPLWERLEMAAMWLAPILLILLPVVALTVGLAAALASGLGLGLPVAGLYALLPRLPMRGRRRYLPLVVAGLAAAGLALGLTILFGAATPGPLVTAGLVAVLGTALVAVDLGGTTPWYPSDFIAGRNPARIELDEMRCDGASDCVQVCPADVLKMRGAERKVEIVRPESCIQCAACIVQCPEDALRFRYADGSVVGAPTIRRTRLNMMGKRRHFDQKPDASS
jgi:NAD-dependent dihydropyrimidine dehydrogenase PreA subunit